MNAVRTAVIHQPDFAPYLGYFHRLLRCDVFVVLDHVQFSKGGWHNRDKIKTPAGERWITIPVRLKGKSFSPINQVAINDDTDWRHAHLMLLECCYGTAPGFAEVFPALQSLYASDAGNLLAFNMLILRWLIEAFAIEVEVFFSSSLSPNGRSNEMLVDILEKVDATDYLSGVGAKDYFREEPFKESGIRVSWQDFSHPVYPQPHGEFIPFLSSLDLLFSLGIQRSRDLLRRIA
jgi:hypothetical protein